MPATRDAPFPVHCTACCCNSICGSGAAFGPVKLCTLLTRSSVQSPYLYAIIGDRLVRWSSRETCNDLQSSVVLVDDDDETTTRRRWLWRSRDNLSQLNSIGGYLSATAAKAQQPLHGWCWCWCCGCLPYLIYSFAFQHSYYYCFVMMIKSPNCPPPPPSSCVLGLGDACVMPWCPCFALSISSRYGGRLSSFFSGWYAAVVGAVDRHSAASQFSRRRRLGGFSCCSGCHTR